MAKSADSLGVQKQINALFEDRVNIENKILSTMQKELKVALQLQSVMSGLSAQELADRLDAGAKAMDALAEKSGEVGDAGTKAMKAVAAESDKAGKSVGIASKAFSGILATAKSMVSAAGGVASGMFKIGKAVLSIPLSIFKNLLADAASFTGDTSFLQALENIRKEFGSFQEDVSKNILGAYHTMSSQLEQVSGLSVWKVFGYPADQLKYIHELASKAGPAIHQFGGELAKSAGIIAAFDKGLGIGGENMRGFMNRATVMGTSVSSQLNDTANYALQLGKQFGMSSKVISHNVGEMMKDVRNFGSLTQKEMTVAAVYTRKLGLETKDLLGLVDKFDNFDKAAESASLLNQAFGATVDAFKLMNEQDPAKRLDEVRKSMQAAGKSTENMSRQELHLLAQTTGLSDEAAKLAFANKNQGLSYDEVQKQANKAENAQLKQADALKKIADNIERVVMQGQQMHGSFFKMFFAGMERGIKWSKEYYGAMQNVRQALWETFWAGDKVGKGFAGSVNVGFGAFVTNFGKIFSPKNVQKIMYGFKDEAGNQARGIVAEFADVFAGRQSWAQAFANFRDQFQRLIGLKENKQLFHDMVEGGKNMLRFVAKGLGSAGHFLVTEFTAALKTLVEFMRNPKKIMEQAGAAAGGAQSFGAELISDFAKSFGDPKALADLKDTLFSFASEVAKVAKKIFEDERVKKVLGEIAKPIMTAILGKAALQMLPTLAKPLLSALAKGLSSLGGGALAGAAGAVAIGAGLVNVNKKLDQYEKGIQGRFDSSSKKVGAYAASLAQGFTLGLLPDDLTQTVASKVAELAQGIFDAIQKQFGGPFTRKMKSYFSNFIGFLGSVGGLFAAILSGDSARISAEAEKVGDRFVTLVGSAVDFLITEAPKLFVKLSATLDKIIGGIVSGLGMSIAKLGDKLGPLGYGLKLTGIIMISLGDAVTSVGKMFEKFFDKLKNFDLDTWLDNVKTGMKGFQVTILESFSKLPNGLLKAFGTSQDELSKSIADMNDKLYAQGAKHAKQWADISDEANKHVEAVSAAAEKARSEAGGGTAVQAQADVDALMEQKKSLEDNLKQLSDFAEKGVVAKVSDMIPKASKAIQDFNDQLSKSSIGSTIDVTQGIVKSVNELNSILGSGDAASIKLGEKLKRYADNSGLGKSGTYEIRNKGIQLKLDLKVTMDAGEVEKAVVLRRESILFDALFDKNSALSDEHRQAIDRVNQLKGGV